MTDGLSARRPRDVRLRDLALVALVVAVDQAVKALVLGRFSVGETHPVVPGFFELTCLLNPGGVWGLGRGLGDGHRTAIFVALPVLITITAGLYAWRLPASYRLQHAALSLVIGGALGNLIDRLRLEPPAVVDFLLFHVRDWYWPAFNLADSSICVGVAILLVSSFLADEEETPGGAGP